MPHQEQTDQVSAPGNPQTGYPSPEALLAGPVEATWHQLDQSDADPDAIEQTLAWVDIGMPGVDTFKLGYGGDLVIDFEGNKVMKTSTLVVPEELEGHHLGEKLMRALTYEAVSKECDEIDVDILHPASAKALLEIFGFDRIHFIGESTSDWIPKSEEELLARVARNWGYPKHQGRRRRLRDVASTKAYIDLKGFDISEFEAPVQLEPEDDYETPEPVVLKTDQEDLTLVEMTTVKDDQEYLEFQNSNRDHIAEFGNSVDANLEEVTERRSAPGNVRFGIRKDGHLIGIVGYKESLDGKEAEMGLLLAKEATGKGYATSALRAMTDYAVAKFERVYAEADPGNSRSIRLCERVGYIAQSGTVQREWNGQVVDAVVLEHK